MAIVLDPYVPGITRPDASPGSDIDHLTKHGSMLKDSLANMTDVLEHVH